MTDGFRLGGNGSSRFHGRTRLLSLVAWMCAAWPMVAQDAPPTAPTAKDGKQAVDPSDEFFKKGVIPKLEILLEPDAIESLRSAPRQYAPCKIRENGKVVYEGVGIKLKGAAGSFREFDDWKPGFTLNMDKFDGKDEFHGLKKFHLNTAVQDDSFLHEWIGSEVFRAAGLAATRVTHARVTAGDRDLGIYVLKEGFDKRFVKRWFPDDDKDPLNTGSLYDGGFCQDIDVDLEKDVGKDKARHDDLHQLFAACREPDVARRWQLIPERVDLDEFLSFMALELMLAHWDGYCVNKNNYRVYFEPNHGKAHFIPHGMDQILNDPGASVLDHPSAILAGAVMRNPEWRAAYRKKVADLLPLFNAKRLEKQIDDVHDRLKPVITAWNKPAGRAFGDRVKSLGEQLEAREKSLKEQKSAPEPKPLVFTEGTPVKLLKWRAASECEDAQLDQREVDTQMCMVIKCGRSKVCVASWRKSVLLPRGKYKLHGMVKLDSVVALEEGNDAPGKGCGLRVGVKGRELALVGTTGFRAIDYEFEVDEEIGDVDLIAELRASRGQAAFRVDSFKLTRKE